jgi:hypothetical protein
MIFIRPQRGCCANLSGGAKLLGTTAPAWFNQACWHLSPSHPVVAEANIKGLRSFTPAKIVSNFPTFLLLLKNTYLALEIHHAGNGETVRYMYNRMELARQC